MANTTGPVLPPQVTTTNTPPVPPPPPGVKSPAVVNAQPVASSYPATQVNQSTQAPQQQARRLHLSERVKQGIAAIGAKPAGVAEKGIQATPAQEAPAEKSEKASETKASEKKASETNAQPITVIHKRSLGERVIDKLKVVGSYLVAPLKLLVNVVKFVTKPLQDYVITPAYKGFLYVFQPAKYDAMKLAQKAAAEKAEHDRKQEKRQAFEIACMNEATKQHVKLNADLSCIRLASQFGVTEQEVEEEVNRQKARADANHLFNKQLKDGKLALHKEKALRVNPETGEQYYVTPTQTLVPADETKRATVTIKEKTPDGKEVEKCLDADDAAVAMRLGNDPALATALNDYNKAMEAYEQKLATFIKDDAKYQQALEKAAKKGKACDQQAPVHPGEPPKRPVFKCTDENVVAAFKLVREQYRTNLQAAADTLTKEVETLKVDFSTAYPDNEVVTHYILNKPDPEAFKAEVQGRVNKLEATLGELQTTLKQAEDSGNQSTVQTCNHQISSLQADINFNKRHLAIYAKECEKATVQQELEYLNRMCPDVQEHRKNDIDDWQNGAYVHDPRALDYEKRVSGTRDRLEIGRLKEWVYKDGKGNVLDIFIKDANGTKVGIDRARYALVNDVIIPSPDKKLTPTYNGKTPALDYQDQQGMKWSKMNPAERPYQGYVAQRDKNGKVLKDSDGNIRWKEAPGQLVNHWVVKHSDVDGRHEGYDKFTTIVKNRELVSESEVPVKAPEVKVPEVKVPVPNTALEKLEQETREAIASMKVRLAACGEKRSALTDDNVFAYKKRLAAENSQQRPRSASVSGVPGKLTEVGSETDDCFETMVRQVFQHEERGRQIRQYMEDSERFQERIESIRTTRQDDSSESTDDSVHNSVIEEIFTNSTAEDRKSMSTDQFVEEYSARKAVHDSRSDENGRTSNAGDGSEAAAEEQVIEPINPAQDPAFDSIRGVLDQLNRLVYLVQNGTEQPRT